jgi:Flp pilus assembly CpaE family ATPase
MLPNTSQQPESFEHRLNAHPELRAKFEVLLSVVENAQGDLIRADAAEQRVVEEIRQLGQTALQEWATRQQEQQSEAFSLENPTAHRGGKKNSIGIADLDASKY